jgi:hypothetical protein
LNVVIEVLLASSVLTAALYVTLAFCCGKEKVIELVVADAKVKIGASGMVNA